MKKWDIYYFFRFSFTITHNFQRWNKVVFTYVGECCEHVRRYQDVEENGAPCPLFLREEVSRKLFDGSWSTVDKGVQFPSTNCKWTKTAWLNYDFPHLEIIRNDCMSTLYVCDSNCHFDKVTSINRLHVSTGFSIEQSPLN